MDNSILSILRQNFTDQIYYTHVSLINPMGKYLFNRQTLEEFWKYYCPSIENKQYEYGVAEKTQTYLPIIADIDLKVDCEKYSEETLYTYEHVEKVIKIYQRVLKDIIEDVEEQHLTCVLLEKPPYKVTANNKTFVKNGFHLHFPELFVDRTDQEIHFLPRVIQLVRDAMIFNYLGLEDSGSVIDKRSVSNPWLLYGSKKDISANPYLVSKVYNAKCEEITVEEAFKHYMIYDNNGKHINIKGKIRYYLPRILSIVPYTRGTKDIRPGLIPIVRAVPTKIREQKVYDKLTTSENIKTIEKLMPMLSDFRADQEPEWMNIGWLFYNISDGSEEGLKLWLTFSQKFPDKYDETKCIYLWDKMEKSDMTIGTLKYYASIDNPEMYKEYKREMSEKLVQESLSGSHNDIARILYSEYGNEFVCASISGKIWYQFIGHRWEAIEEGVFLREKISTVVVNIFRQGRKMLGDDNVKDEEIQNKLKQLGRIIKDLKSAPFKDNVMKEAREVFYDKRFRDKLDNNPKLIAFKNGVFDLEADIFRAGKPEDFISKSMPINFKQFSEEDQKVQEIYNFLEKVFPDKSIRTYFLDTSSEIFMGGNQRKIFQIWTGDGDNAKSVTQMFFELMLGSSLSIKIPTTLVTSKKPLSGAAWPELARAGGGVRAAWIEEIDESEQIYAGIVKHLTGNDSFVARDLFEKGKDMKEIKPMFKLFFICNKPSQFVGGGDKALWNRARILPFESTFCRENDPAPETYEEQLRQKRFPMDKDFSAKIPGLVEAFAWVLLQHRTKPKQMMDPEKVRSATSAYRQRNDVYRQFMEECIKEDENGKISIAELYTQLKDWYRESLPGCRVPVKADVKTYFSKIWGDVEIGCKWRGYSVRSLQDDVDDGKTIILGEEDFVNYGPPM